MIMIEGKCQAVSQKIYRAKKKPEKAYDWVPREVYGSSEQIVVPML